MNRALVKGSMGNLPPELVCLFNDPPLVGDEKREDYENFFSAIVSAINPGDAIAWVLARDFTDLTWRSGEKDASSCRSLRLRNRTWSAASCHNRSNLLLRCLLGSRGREAGQGSETMGR